MPMMTFTSRGTTQGLLVMGLLLSSLGCSLHRAQKAFNEGRYDDAVATYREILQKDSQNYKARLGMRRAAVRAAEAHLEAAREAYKRGLEDRVYMEVRKAAVLDPSNAVAMDWLANLETAAQKRKADQESEENLDEQRIKAEAKNQLQLNPRSLDGVDLNFSRKTSLKEIFGVISKASGVNILMHSSYQDLTVSVDLRGLNFQRILDTLMLQNDLFYRVVDANTLMVFKATPQNRDLYENQLLKTFYLSNADPDMVRTVFQSLMPTLKVYPEKRLNAIIIKAKPNELTIAQRIVNQLDKAQAEVMVYVELLEVTENSLEQVGLLPVLSPGDGLRGGFGMFRVGATIDNTGGPNVNKGGIRIKSDDIRYLFPSLALDALKSNGDAKLVASPNVRVLSGEKGEINIGEKISTTQSSIGFGNVGTTGTTGTTSGALGGLGTGLQTQFSYEDVGVKIAVEPRVHQNGDITLKLDSEITTLKSSSSAGRPDLGRRKVTTKARLRDGETALFAGLLKDEEQKSLQGIWGLTDVPVLGKLLGNNYKQRAKTDVILTIRVALVRKPDLGQADFEAFDPDSATSKAGPFTPKEVKKPTTVAPLPPPPAKPATPPPAAVPAPQAPAPEAPKPAETPVKAAEAPVAAAPTVEPSASDLAVFMSPLSQQVGKGEKTQVTLLVSGGKGLSSGVLELKVDSRLKLVSATPGDFLVAEGGSLEQAAGADGVVRLSFRRNSANADSGTLAVLEVEALAKGNAPVLVQKGSYLVGTNPIAAKIWNALVTVE